MSNQTEPLGLTMYVSVYAVRACPPPEQMQKVLEGLVQYIGMTTGGLAPATWFYPWEGMGGEGETMVFPFLTAQPLMESLSMGLGAVAGDSWREHGGVYIIVASCRQYNLQQVCAYLGQRAGKIVSFGEAPPVSLKISQ